MMNKVNQSILITLILILSLSFFSCENFMDGGEFIDKLNKDIEYSNARPLTIYTTCSNIEGSITSPSPISKKKTDSFVVIFQPNEEAEFKYWKAVYRNTDVRIDGSEDAVENIVSFIDENGKDWSRELEAHVLLTGETSSEIQIKPEVSIKPAVKTISPAQSSSTIYPKNSSIRVEFTTEIDPDSFFYSEADFTEKYSAYDAIKNQAGQIYAYGFIEPNPEKTAFKNISIFSDNQSILNNFYEVTLSTKEITVNQETSRYSVLEIQVDPDNPMDVKGNTKLIRVELGSGIKDLAGTEILLNEKISWYYTVHNKTEEQSKIQFAQRTANSGKLIPSRTDTAEYNTLENISISFKANEDYVFDCWEIADEYAPVIYIDDKYAEETYVTPLASSDYIRVEAIVKTRPKVTQTLPLYNESNPAYKNESIIIKFNKAIPESNFFFTDAEINTIAPNGGTFENDGKIYAYRNNNVLYYKNIKIEDTNSLSDKNILKYFDCPVWNEENYTLTIPVHEPDTSNNESYISFGLNETFKAINVILSESIVDFDNIPFSKSYNFTYTICDKTSTQTKILLTVAEEKGKVIPEYKDGQPFNIHDKFNLTFMAKAGYAFDKWIITKNDENYITIEDVNAASTVVTVNAYTSATIEISPLVKTQAELSAHSPSPLDEATTYPKDTPLVLTFSKLIDEKEFYFTIEEIREHQGSPYKKGSKTIGDITYYAGYITDSNGNAFYKNVSIFDSDGKNVCEHYSAPLVEHIGDTTRVTYNVNDSWRSKNNIWYNYLVNPESETEITVIVSNKIRDTEALPLKENYDFSYKLNNKTINQTAVSFENVSGIGNLTPSGTGIYSTHDEFELRYVKPVEHPASYKFLGFNCSDEKVVISNLQELDDGNEYRAIVTVNNYVASGVKINPVFIGISPEYTEAGVYKDSGIKIDFYREISESNADNLSSLIEITDAKNNNLKAYFNTPLLTTSPDTHYSSITISPKELLPFAEDYKDIIVKISKNIDEAFEENISYTYRVNSETSNKTTILLTSTTGSGNVTASATGPYNIGQIFTVTFDCLPSYQFASWTSSDNENITIQNADKFTATIIVNKYTLNQITVTANAESRPEILPNYSPEKNTTVAKDTSIRINFSKAIALESLFFTEEETSDGTGDYAFEDQDKNYYAVKYDNGELKTKGINVFSGQENLLQYYDMVFSEEYKTLELNAKRENLIPVTNTKHVTVSLSDSIYDTSNNKNTLTQGLTWTFTVNNTTNAKTTLRYNLQEAGSATIRVDNADILNGNTKVMNLGQESHLEYPLSSGYEFIGWKVSAPEGYTVSPSDYVTGGLISVRKNNADYITLTIDSVDATRADVKALNAVAEGDIVVFVCDEELPKIESVKVNNVANILDTNSNICDSKIYFNFNKYMNNNSVTLSNNGSITITKNGSPTMHYEDYFTTSWMNENTQNGYKTLIISPKQNITDLVPDTSDKFNFLITLNANKKYIRDKANFILQRSEAINNSFDIVYTISGEREHNPPVLKGATLLNKHSNDENARKLSDKELGEWKKNDFNLNHLSTSFFMSLGGSDSDSGISYFKVTETLLQKLNNEAVDSTPVFTTYATDNGKYEGFHTFKTLSDGVIQLDFEAVDYAGNVSSKITYYVVKNTVINTKDAKENELINTIQIDFTSDRQNMTNEDNDTGVEEIRFQFLPVDYSVPVLGNDNWRQYIHAKILYSYDENEFIDKYQAKLKDNKGIYQFQHDPTKITYLKVILYDDIGNEKTYMRFIPARPDFGAESVVQETYDGKTRYKILPSHWDDYKSYESKFGLPVEMEIEYFLNTNLTTRGWSGDNPQLFYHNGEVTTYDQLSSLGNVIEPSTLKWEPGDYYINICVANGKIGSSRDQVFFTSILSDTTLVYRIKKSGGVEIRTGSLRSGKMNEEILDGYSPYVAIQEIQQIQNAGACKIKLWPKEFEGDETFTYTLRAKNIQTYTCFDFTEFDRENSEMYINLPTPAEYNMRIIKSRDGKSYTTLPLILIQGQSQSENLTLTYDCTPPKFSGSSIWSTGFPFAYNMMYSNWYPGNTSVTEYSNSHPVDESGMYQNEDGLGEIDYWILPNYSSSVLFGTQYTEEDLNNTYANLMKTVTYDLNQYSLSLPHDNDNTKHQSRIEIPYDGLEEGSYTIGLRAKDIHGNYSYYFTPFCNRLLNQKMQFTANVVIANAEKLIFTHSHASNSAENFHFYYYDTVSERWICSDKADNVHLTSSINHPAGLSGRWGRFVGFKGSDSDTAGFFDIEYVYLDYWKVKGTDSEWTLNLKNVIPGLTGLQVYCDQPTLVHTLYCSKKLTETSEEEDVTVWENKATETGVVTKDETFSYTKDNYYNNIPSGYYYTTVIHFADGTKVMTEVKQK